MSEKVYLRHKIIVLKLSGRLFFSEDFDNVADVLKETVKKKRNYRLVVVAGGAKIARKYIRAAQMLGADHVSQDELGIQSSRLNARVLSTALGRIASSESPSTFSALAEALEVTDRHKVVFVIGGTQPGQSTNAVAALAAEKLNSNMLINATDVGGVYTKDPHKFKNSKLLPKVTPRRLAKILKGQSMKPGGYDLMDPIALKIIERSKIKTRIVNCDGRTLRTVLLADKRPGTEIVC